MMYLYPNDGKTLAVTNHLWLIVFGLVDEEDHTCILLAQD